jgi:hypothetical protein
MHSGVWSHMHCSCVCFSNLSLLAFLVYTIPDLLFHYILFMPSIFFHISYSLLFRVFMQDSAGQKWWRKGWLNQNLGANIKWESPVKDKVFSRGVYLYRSPSHSLCTAVCVHAHICVQEKCVTAHLQRAEGLGEGWHPDQVGGNNDGWGVVSVVVALDSHVSCNESTCLRASAPPGDSRHAGYSVIENSTLKIHSLKFRKWVDLRKIFRQ